MNLFVVVMLVLIIFGIQHLLNWGWREAIKYDGEVPMFMLTCFAIFASVICLKFIILWGSNI